MDSPRIINKCPLSLCGHKNPFCFSNLVYYIRSNVQYKKFVGGKKKINKLEGGWGLQEICWMMLMAYLKNQLPTKSNNNCTHTQHTVLALGGSFGVGKIK